MLDNVSIEVARQNGTRGTFEQRCLCIRILLGQIGNVDVLSAAHSPTRDRKFQRGKKFQEIRNFNWKIGIPVARQDARKNAMLFANCVLTS